ncbi:MAG: type II toxin-antitoxin system PemK/MazF family toxin [Nanoarchaeota archaeon]|mgnify:CR=1 FL=1
MIVNQKEIVLLPYPFSNLESSKVRPAIIVSNDIFNRKSADCIAIPLTTVIKNEQYSIILNQEDLSSGKLLKPSRARADKIFAVEKNIIVMKIGTINDKIFEKIKAEIAKMF